MLSLLDIFALTVLAPTTLALFASIPIATFYVSAAVGHKYFIAVTVAYLTACRILRYRRRDAMHKKFYFPTKESLKRMSTDQAYEIDKYVKELEFPTLYDLGGRLGIFQTYGIPSLSKLLVSTGQLSSKESPIDLRRYVETVLLIKEFSTYPPHDERVIKAIARINYMHRRHFKSGMLLNEDMLYTLRQFITMPFEYIDTYEWRPLTDMERCAAATSWKWYGEALGIKYDGYLARSSWENGLEWYGDLNNWAKKYEEEYMVPADTNKFMYDISIPILSFRIPTEYLRLQVRSLITALMPEMLTTAMKVPHPHPIYHHTITTLLKARRFLLRHAALPRPSAWAYREVDEASNGRSYFTDYDSDPYYVQPTLMARYGPKSWWVRIMGTGVPGEGYVSEGYAAPYLNVGPEFVRNRGEKDAVEMEREILESGVSRGCPFGF